MITISNNITTYYLNPDNFKERTEILLKVINDLKLKNTIRIVSNAEPICKANNTTNAHIKLLEEAINNKQYPFLLLEDDVRIIKNFSWNFDVPDECDAIYLGGSVYDDISIKPNLYLTDYNDYFYRLYHTFTTHAIIIINEKFAINYKKVCESSLENCIPNDVGLALMSKDYIVLTPKEGPYLYQDGYNEHLTRFLWKNIPSLLKS
jgi:hypothetical protein